VQFISQPLRSKPVPFDHSDDLYELKYDGFRALAHLENGPCQLISRNGSKFGAFADLASEIASSVPLTKSAVIDGEIVCLDAEGRPQFNDLLFHRGQPVLFAFDIIVCEGQDLRMQALIERKAELRRVLSRAPLSSPIRYADHVERAGSALFGLVCQRDLEGVVAKLSHGNYVTERDKSTWFKIKNRAYSQSEGREELFERDRHAEPIPGWHSCAVACAAMEMEDYERPC
jgi:bifunctional non-homologous end joining protein LigD